MVMRLALLVLCFCTSNGVYADEVIGSQPNPVDQLVVPTDRLMQGRQHSRRQLEMTGTKRPCTVPGFVTPGVCVYYRDVVTGALVIHFLMYGELVAIDDQGLIWVGGIPL